MSKDHTPIGTITFDRHAKHTVLTLTANQEWRDGPHTFTVTYKHVDNRVVLVKVTASNSTLALMYARQTLKHAGELYPVTIGNHTNYLYQGHTRHTRKDKNP